MADDREFEAMVNELFSRALAGCNNTLDEKNLQYVIFPAVRRAIDRRHVMQDADQALQALDTLMCRYEAAKGHTCDCDQSLYEQIRHPLSPDSDK